MGLFSKKIENPESLLLKEENRKMIEQDQKLKSDIKYLESQYDEFVMSSLVSDFNLYKEFIDKNGHSHRNEKFWMIDDHRSDEFSLSKGDGTSYGPNIRLRIKHNGRINDSFEITEIVINVNSRRVTLSNRRFTDIIFKYIMTRKLRSSKSELVDSKNSFEYMINIIGKDVRRDLKIEEILNS